MHPHTPGMRSLFPHPSLCERISPFLTSSLPAEIIFIDREAKEGINSSQDETCHCLTILICTEFSHHKPWFCLTGQALLQFSPSKVSVLQPEKLLLSERSPASECSWKRAQLRDLGREPDWHQRKKISNNFGLPFLRVTSLFPLWVVYVGKMVIKLVNHLGNNF